MSVIHLQQIKGKLKSSYQDLILIPSNIKDDNMRESYFYTRAMPAFVIEKLAKVSAEIAIQSSVDDTEDNGIDSIHFDEQAGILYLIQSKWIKDGKGEPSAEEYRAFFGGIVDLMNMDFDRFNEKVKSKSEIITKALTMPGILYKALMVYPSQDGVAKPAQLIIDDFVSEINDAGDILEFKTIKQSDIYAFILKENASEEVHQTITLSSWGKTENPHLGYYGQVKCSDVLNWWKDHGSNLFSKNIRGFLGDTDVNNEIINTLKEAPQHFWYFNNGITMVASKVERAAAGAGDREYIKLKCESVSIVNGAQTVSSIGNSKLTSEELESAIVPFRVISLSEGGEEFGSQITKANNRQNRIEARDFVSSDPCQIKIKSDLNIEKVDYNLTRSSSYKPSENSFDFTEAAIALACSSDVAYAVQAKREVGKLWEDITKAPYKKLFNPNINPFYVWKIVLVQRYIDTLIQQKEKNLSTKEKGVLTHGNRLLSHLIFTKLSIPAQFIFEYALNKKDLENIEGSFNEMSDLLLKEIEKSYAKAVLPTLFKNQKKCFEIKESISSNMKKKKISKFKSK